METVRGMPDGWTTRGGHGGLQGKYHTGRPVEGRTWGLSCDRNNELPIRPLILNVEANLLSTCPPGIWEKQLCDGGFSFFWAKTAYSVDQGKKENSRLSFCVTWEGSLGIQIRLPCWQATLIRVTTWGGPSACRPAGHNAAACTLAGIHSYGIWEKLLHLREIDLWTRDHFIKT